MILSNSFFLLISIYGDIWCIVFSSLPYLINFTTVLYMVRIKDSVTVLISVTASVFLSGIKNGVGSNQFTPTHLNSLLYSEAPQVFFSVPSFNYNVL